MCRWGYHKVHRGAVTVGHHAQTGCRQDAPLCSRVAQETSAGAAVADEKQPAHTADAQGHYYDEWHLKA